MKNIFTLMSCGATFYECGRMAVDATPIALATVVIVLAAEVLMWGVTHPVAAVDFDSNA